MNKKKRSLNKRKILLEVLIILISAITLIVSAALIWISGLQMPDFNTVATRQMESTTKIYDKTGKVLLFAFREKIRRTEVPLSKISPNVVKATISIEDDQFYNHGGISFRGIVRAFYINLFSSKTQGGSTITQQVVKNALLTQEKTLERKIKEIILSIKLEQALTKDQILATYLNDAPYGGEIYGVEEASQYYFATSSSFLSIPQAAYLAAIPKNPNKFNPYGKFPELLEERKNVVLRRMLETNNVSKEDYEKALVEKVVFVKKEDNISKAHHFVFFVKDYLEKKYGEDFMTKGLSVTTTLDYDLQKEAEETAKTYIESYIKREQPKNKKVNISTLNTGLVALDAPTGQILMMVGSRDYSDEKIDGKYNIATALRQPGSSIKPIIYAAAFEKGLDPETVVFDSPTEFNTGCPLADGTRRDAPCYSPQNYDEGFFGGISIREALGNSRNIPAVKTLYLVGVQNAIDFAKRLGITSLKGADRYGLSLVLGGGEVSLLELTAAYGPFSQGGDYNKPTAILEIKDKDGKILEEYKDSKFNVLSPDTAAKISSILSDNSARSRVFGPYSKLYFPGSDVAAKTGTTNNVKDGWVIGYTTDTLLGGWVGKNDNTSFGEVNASLSIVPLWNTIFTKIIAKKSPGYLNKEYNPNPELDGQKCSPEGRAMDIIQTAIAYSIFSNIRSGDAQENRWLTSSSACAAVETSSSTPITAVSTTTPL